ncbi:hypothetical protein OAB28_02290, partial [Amylibacter sp.]|nr:hypothetical protein [Amylibacter sp.]
MRPMLKVNTMNLKCSKSVLLGTSALVCLALSAPVMADDFVITGSNGSTNGTGTRNGGFARLMANDINGSDTVSLGIALTTTGTNVGIKTNNNDTEAQSNTVTVTKTGSITTGTGNNAYGIFNDGAYNTTTVSGSITTGVVGTNAGEDSTGIWNYGNDNTTTLTSTGVITVNGPKADGIYNSSGDKNITIVHGSIFVNGNGVADDYAEGITNYGDDNETTLSGSITTTGNYAMGIANYGNNNKVTISGTVKSTGAKSGALYNYSGSGNSFTLNEGATIIGDILAVDEIGTAYDATNSKLIFNLGASTSYAYSVSGKGEGTTAGQWDFDD